jgi:hypothetical protein
VGRLEGRAVGVDVGTEDIGFDIGALLGTGETIGTLEGRTVGEVVGTDDGIKVGRLLVGLRVGTDNGDQVGI